MEKSQIIAVSAIFIGFIALVHATALPDKYLTKFVLENNEDRDFEHFLKEKGVKSASKQKAIKNMDLTIEFKKSSSGEANKYDFVKTSQHLGNITYANWKFDKWFTSKDYDGVTYKIAFIAEDGFNSIYEMQTPVKKPSIGVNVHRYSIDGKLYMNMEWRDPKSDRDDDKLRSRRVFKQI